MHIIFRCGRRRRRASRSFSRLSDEIILDRPLGKIPNLLLATLAMTQQRKFRVSVRNIASYTAGYADSLL